MIWYKKKNKSKQKLPKLKMRSFLNTDWITNFWIVDNQVWFTDADLALNKSLIATISLANLQENLLENKSDWERNFLAHPDPLKSSLIQASITDLTFLQQYDGYVYNVSELNKQIFISIVQGINGVVLLGKQVVYHDLVLLGELNGQLIAKKTIDKQTIVLLDNNFFAFENDNIKKIVKVGEKEVYLNTKNQIIYNQKIVYESSDELSICQFDPLALLVSEKSTLDLFYLTGEHFQIKKIIWKGNYFFHLLVLDKKIIIGKPLFDQQGKLNFGLPPIFIY